MANFHITQSIHIHSIKIERISNSSVFQIGSSGIIKPMSTTTAPNQPDTDTGKEPSFQIAPPKQKQL